MPRRRGRKTTSKKVEEKAKTAEVPSKEEKAVEVKKSEEIKRSKKTRTKGCGKRSRKRTKTKK